MKQNASILFHGDSMAQSVYDGNGRRKYLTRREGTRFMKAAGVMPTRERLLCETLYFTGCRISEALGLSGHAMDREEKVLRIPTLKQRKIIVRRIPIPSNLVEKLDQLSEGPSELWPYSRTTAWRIVKTVMLLAEIYGPQACPKGLRHGFGVRAALSKVPISQISVWMGHANIDTTAIYLDVKDREDRELMSRTWGGSRF